MKNYNFLVILFLFLLSSTSYGQTEEIKTDLDQAIKEMSETLEDLDLNKLINEDLFGKIEKLKPSKNQLKQIEGIMHKGLETLESIDFSAIEEMMVEVEKSLNDLELGKLLEGLDEKSDGKKSEKKQQGKKI